MDPEAFRAAAHAVVDLMADYLARVEDYPVLPAIEPGTIRPQLPATPPERPEPLDAILADYRAIVEPNATHWQHPGFFAYFASTASEPGILGEMLAAALAQNPMLWRTSPIGTELEGVVVDWLRQALGLPATFDGLLTDTASTSSLIAIAAAREAAGLDVAARGLAGRDDLRGPRVYASAEAHSSIEKACMTLGIGRAGLRRIPVDDAYRMRVDALEAAIAEDRAAGRQPIAIVATIGTTARRRSTRWRTSRRSPSARGCGSTSTLRTPGRSPSSRACAGHSPAGSGRTRSSSTRTSGCSRRLTRRSCSPAGWTACEPRSASSPSTCARSTGRPRPRLQRVPAPARTPFSGAQAVDPAPLVRARRAAPADRPPRRARAAVRRLGRRRSRLGAPRTGPVLDGLFPLAAGPAGRARGRARGPGPARRAERRDHGRSQPDG